MHSKDPRAAATLHGQFQLNIARCGRMLGQGLCGRWIVLYKIINNGAITWQFNTLLADYATGPFR